MLEDGRQILDHPLDADVLGEDPPSNRDLGATSQGGSSERLASVQTATGLVGAAEHDVADDVWLWRGSIFRHGMWSDDPPVSLTVSVWHVLCTPSGIVRDDRLGASHAVLIRCSERFHDRKRAARGNGACTRYDATTTEGSHLIRSAARQAGAPT